MRHPYHPVLRLPDVFVALRAYLLDGFDPQDGLETSELAMRRYSGLLCGEISPTLLDSEDPNPYGELVYRHQPLEIIPFCHAGTDGLHYGWAVLAPELDLPDQICVSFAPVDDNACWLGDTTKEALENLLVGAIAGWRKWSRQKGDPPPTADPRWSALREALDLNPKVDSMDITAGARSSREIRPVEPVGWRYQPARDGIGVLAPASAFASQPVDLDNWWDQDERRTRAMQFLAAGYPASALVVLKWTFTEREDMLIMRDAYQALGRNLHAERATIWLDLNR